MRRTITGAGAQLRFSISYSLSLSFCLSLSFFLSLSLSAGALIYTSMSILHSQTTPRYRGVIGYRLRYSPPSQRSSLSPLHLHTNIRLGSFSKEEQNRTEQHACFLANRALLFSARATLLVLLLRCLANERKKERGSSTRLS